MLLVLCLSVVIVSFLFVIFTQAKLGKVESGPGKHLDCLNLSEVHWFTSQDKNPATITVLLELSHTVTLEALQDGITERVIVPALRSNGSLRRLISVVRKIGNKYVFTDAPQLEITDHVKEINGVLSRDQLMSVIGTMFSTSLDPSKPLWLLTLATLDTDRSALVFQLHHSIADGVSLVRLLLEQMIDEPVQFILPYMNGGMSCCDRIIKGLRLPLDIFKLLFMDSLRPGDRNGYKQKMISGNKLVADTSSIKLSDIKSIASAAPERVTINDVLTTSILSALAEYLSLQNKEVRPEQRIRVVFPIFLDKLTDELELRNKYSLILLPLPLLPNTKTPDALRSALSKVSHLLTSAKKSNIPAVTLLLEKMALKLPESAANRILNWQIGRTTMCMSNMIGPRNHVRILGKTVESITPFVPTKGNMCGYLSIVCMA